MSRLAFLILITFTTVSAQSREELEGKWYIQYSNFPMWLKGDKQNPTFNYIFLSENKILDQVKFQKNGKFRRITGTDTPLNSQLTRFIWRGSGLLFFARSRWSILHFDPENRWALIKFQKTMFTPAGFDIITREKKPDPEILEMIGLYLTNTLPEENLQRIFQQ